jgi:hypothetical protein
MADSEADPLCYGVQSLGHHLPYRLFRMEDHEADTMDPIERGKFPQPNAWLGRRF